MITGRASLKTGAVLEYWIIYLTGGFGRLFDMTLVAYGLIVYLYLIYLVYLFFIVTLAIGEYSREPVCVFCLWLISEGKGENLKGQI